LEEGEDGLEPKKKSGNPLSRYERRKELTYEEQLQYQIELLKRELLKKEAEVLRLKKLNERKGGRCPKKLIQEIYAEIQKQATKHSIIELCSIYGVSRSGYYKWLKRADRLNRYEKTQKILDSYVLDIHSHHPMIVITSDYQSLNLDFIIC